MTRLFDMKAQVLAERNGWSIARALGYCRGEAARRRGQKPSTYSIVGIDEYALGFRAGYFLRDNPPRAEIETELPQRAPLPVKT